MTYTQEVPMGIWTGEAWRHFALSVTSDLMLMPCVQTAKLHAYVYNIHTYIYIYVYTYTHIIDISKNELKKLCAHVHIEYANIYI